VLVRYENANRKTSVRNNAGPGKLIWEARFPGSYSALLVDGVAQKANHRSLNGVEMSSVVVAVEPGRPQTVTTGAISGVTRGK
jgi:hypothetical protein